MPWKEVSPMSELEQFVAEYRKEGKFSSFAGLCRRFGISRKTGYKWVERAGRGEALVPQSRAPITHPQSVAEDVERAIIAVRAGHPTWGPRKILAWLGEKEPGLPLCAAST